MCRLRLRIDQAAATCHAEHYRKHFHSFAHACLLLFHGFSGGQSLRQSYGAFGLCAGLVKLSELGTAQTDENGSLSVSFSQFADSNTTRPAEFLSLVVSSLITQVYQQGLGRSAGLPLDLRILDSTHLKLSVKLASWLPSQPGVRIQCQYAPALDLPEHVYITHTRLNDCQGFDLAILDQPLRLANLRGKTLILDLGYYAHRRFQCLLDAGIHFVSRLRVQVSVQILEESPVQSSLFSCGEERIQVLRDQRVSLGSPNNRAGAVLHGVRLITAHVAPRRKAKRQGAQVITYQIVTDRWDLSAEEIVAIYLCRWQIELFFRWLKSHVHLPRLLGYSQNAVQLTVWLALLVHLLTVLAAFALNLARRSPTLLTKIRWMLSALRVSDLRDPSAYPIQLAFPWDIPAQGPT